MIYRKEIDSLRAIAVVPVILFHAGISGFEGGYVGVDIFFVISGYLITSIILDERKRGCFSFANFYERRARRILPALSLVLLATTVTAYLMLPARYLQNYSVSLLSVATFWSNIYFYQSGGYFSTLADHKPLLHTWSLAIEEQYYLLFPILLVALYPKGRRTVFLAIAAIAVMSFFMTQVLISARQIDMNFYLLLSRAWELMLGSMLAFLPRGRPTVPLWIRDLLGFTGLLLIAYAVHFLHEDTPFPGVATLIPVLGSCLIILFVTENSRVGRLMSIKMLVTIGLLSYSLYLWHQPLFAFLRLGSVGVPSSKQFGVMIAITSLLAYVSWKYVEMPFRDKKRFSRHTLFISSLAVITTFFGVGMVGYIGKGFAQRFIVQDYHESIKFSPKRKTCHTRENEDTDPAEACRYFGGNISWAVLGDSHAVELAFAIARELESHDQGLLHLSRSGCLPALSIDLANRLCSKWSRDSVAYLEKTSSIKQVVLTYRYSIYLYGDHLDTYPELPDKNPSERFAKTDRMLNVGDPREAVWNSFAETVKRLMAAGKTVHILYPAPELPLHIRQAVLPNTVFGDTPRVDLTKTVSESYYLRRNAYILSKLNALPYGAHLRAVKPFDIFCADGYCPAVRDGAALYVDSHHVSLAGASYLAKTIVSP